MLFPVLRYINFFYRRYSNIDMSEFNMSNATPFVEKERISVKKSYLVVILLSCIVIFASVIIVLNLPTPETEPDLITFRVNGAWGPLKLDPIEAREPPCVWVISQVAEGLFDFNETTDEIVPNLATSYSISVDHLEFSFNLRKEVKFHDGTDFNAQAVKWNFDRLYDMMVIRPSDIPEARLWKLSDGSRIVNNIQVVNDSFVKFVLNEPYAPFLGLLTTWSAFIVSPTSTPSTDLIDLSTGDLIGTGPFVYDELIPNTEVRLSANTAYWGGKPKIDKLVFPIFGFSVGNENIESIYETLYSGELDLAPKIRRYPFLGNYSFFSNKIQAEPSLLLDEDPLDTSYNYIGMNNNLINITWRKALAYALDYDYILEVLNEGWAERMKSPLPEGIPYSNTDDFNVPILNLTEARKTIKNALGSQVASLPLEDDDPWIALVGNNTPLATFNFTYDQGNVYRESLLIAMQNNFQKIGVKILGAPMPFISFIYRAYDLLGYHRDMLELYHLGWIADFNDPFNYINQLMSNESVDNISQINDATLQFWMEQAQIEYNSTKREELYINIQERFIEEIYPWIMLDIPKIVSIQAVSVRGFCPTSMQWRIPLKRVYFT
jgi:peptide/nickel transport system substrate-binding protein